MKNLKVYTIVQSGRTWKYIEAGKMQKGETTVTLYKAHVETFDVFGYRYFQYVETVQALPAAIEQSEAA